MYLILVVNYGLMVGRKVQYKTFHQLNVLWSFENWQKNEEKGSFNFVLRPIFWMILGYMLKKSYFMHPFYHLKVIRTISE